MTSPFLLQHLLRNSALRYPNGIAVKSPTGKITYSDLENLTDCVASTLQDSGARKGDRIGICLSKSVASIISVYAILKAGCAYVPLDPDAPPQRLAVIAKDCGIRIMLTSSTKEKTIGEITTLGAPIETVVMIDSDTPAQTPPAEDLPGVLMVSWDEARRSKGKPADPGNIESDAAYVLYTSGSTGIPKGVVLSHRNSLAFVEWAADYTALSSEDVVACHAPLHFDISTFSIFSTCLAGGTVFLFPERASTFPVELARTIEREGLTVWYSVPSALTLLTLFGNLKQRDLSKLRAIIFAGEVFPLKFLKQLISHVPHAKYLNWYGPTETNVCTSYEVNVSKSNLLSEIPIGKACSNTEVFAITEDGVLVTGKGQVGELYVRGPTVMQGYWGDLEKTDKLLVSNPLNMAIGEKVYRTGDLVSLDEGGNYLYLGRRDGMIKTRGYRVELGEIESAIYSHPAVQEAVVVPVPDDLIGNRLHAFIAPNPNSNISREEILGHCGRKLPKYMVPDGVSFMKELPKTSSGKMDRVVLLQKLTMGKSS